jgi:hypothetical protein
VYYHVSYWGPPHDYLWLCTTPPALIREEMTKAYDHNARRYWILNVGDLKPAEIDIDYFMQLATDEPRMAKMSQREFLTEWFGEQFPTTVTNSTLGDSTKPGFPLSTFTKDESGKVNVVTTPSPSFAAVLADILTRYYALNFIRKPEFMGFNGYNDSINRTAFNPMAWGRTVSSDELPLRSNDITIHERYVDITNDQNHARAAEWRQVHDTEKEIVDSLPPQYASAFFELVGYPIEASAAQNEKFLATDLTYLDAHNHDDAVLAADTASAHAAYDAIQSFTAKYNALENGKWDGMMDAAPRQRHVFEMPRTAADTDATTALPAAWFGGEPNLFADLQTGIYPPPPPGFRESLKTVSINASHFARSHDSTSLSAPGHWRVLTDLGISGDSVEYGSLGLANSDVAMPTSGPQDSAWLEYNFTTTTNGPATLALHMLPTFPIDSDHRLRYAVSLDGAAPIELDAAAPAAKASASAGDDPANSGWAENVLRNSAIAPIPLGPLAPGKHTLRLISRDPGVVYEHLVLTFPGAPPAYPVPPETR